MCVDCSMRQGLRMTSWPDVHGIWDCVLEWAFERTSALLAVEKLPLRNFYPADEYHQDYLDKHPNGYCHLPKALFDFARKAK